MTIITDPPTQGQVSFALPPDIPAPAFLIGQTVQVVDPSNDIEGGRIVGMEWISRDVALAENTKLGWWYTLEVDPFKHRFRGRFGFCEKDIKLSTTA